MKKPYKMPKNYICFEYFERHIKHMKMCHEMPKNFKISNNLTSPVFEEFAYLANSYKDQPIYCVRQSLLDDMRQTDVNENIPLFLDLKLSIPYFALFFPKNTIESPLEKDGKIGYINYMIAKLELTESSNSEFKYVFTWGAIDTEDRIIFSYKRIRRNGTFKRSYFSIDDQGLKDRTLMLSNIVLQSILLLEYYPDIQEKMTTTDLDPDQKGFGKHNKCDLFRLPRWLGYQPRTTQNTSHTEGSGSPKSAHFRRGFWRSQPIGKDRAERQVIYIQPTWVNKIAD
jgi:hypothetical protein